MVYFQTEDPNLSKFFEGCGMEKVRIFYGYLEYIMAIWYILWHLDNLITIWYVSQVWVYCVRIKSGNPVLNTAPEMGNEEFLPDTSISSDADLNPDLVGGVMIRDTPEQCQVSVGSTLAIW
jgi:hypothetical protein